MKHTSGGIRGVVVWFCLFWCSYSSTGSNSLPLDFGMTPEAASAALRAPLAYISGPPGSEKMVANLPAGTPGFYTVDSLVFLQFRRGKLTGWKKDVRVRPHVL